MNPLTILQCIDPGTANVRLEGIAGFPVHSLISKRDHDNCPY